MTPIAKQIVSVVANAFIRRAIRLKSEIESTTGHGANMES